MIQWPKCTANINKLNSSKSNCHKLCKKEKQTKKKKEKKRKEKKEKKKESLCKNVFVGSTYLRNYLLLTSSVNQIKDI